MPKASKKPNLDSVTTINTDGSRYFLHPADVRGWFTRMRRYFGLALLLVYLALPWITINHHPAVYLDVDEKKFHFMGLTFVAQDFFLGFFLISGIAFGLFYVTALFGRLWCGWACPYTVFLEHVFRRIERFIEGDAPARRQLDNAPWTGEKIFKRVLKHGLFYFSAVVIALVFLSYFKSGPGVLAALGSPGENLGLIAFVVVAATILYFCFSWFREQFCIILCPYGRIQSALTDEDTIIIGYDEKRGEPRGKPTDPESGDCIACNRCVQVCPTGIDIRNGLQMECIGCAACVDACDTIMEKVGRPKGLVRYDSMNGLTGGKTRLIRPRILLYTGFMVLGLIALGISLTTIHDVHVEVTRMRGQPYFLTDDAVRNQFRVDLATKRNTPTTFKLELENAPASIGVSGLEEEITVEAQGKLSHPVVASFSLDEYEGPATLTLRVTSQPGGTTLRKKVRFLGPDPALLEPLPDES